MKESFLYIFALSILIENNLIFDMLINGSVCMSHFPGNPVSRLSILSVELTGSFIMFIVKGD